MALDVGEPLHQLRQPSDSIPPEITAVTGITDTMVAGKSIDPAEVSAFAAPAALVVAHNMVLAVGGGRQLLAKLADEDVDDFHLGLAPADPVSSWQANREPPTRCAGRH